MTIVTAMIVDDKMNRKLHGLAVTVITAMIFHHGLVMITIMAVMSNVGNLVLSKMLHRLAVTVIMAVICYHGLVVITIMAIIT